MTMSAELY